MASIAISLGTELLGSVAKKSLGGGRRKNIRGEKQEGLDMPRDNILLRKLPTPKRVQLPNVRVFYAKYLRVGRANLPPNVWVRRRYVRKTGPKRQRKRCRNQVGSSLPSKAILKTAYNIGKKASGSNFGKMLMKEGIDCPPTMYKKAKKIKKNKSLKKLPRL